MGCGDSFSYMLVTADGKTPADPCDAFCGPLDYSETRNVAVRVGDEVLKRWQKALSYELARSKTPPADRVPPEHPDRDEIYAQRDAFAAALEGVPHPFLESLAPRSQLSYREAVDAAWFAAGLGLCAMERLDELITYYGGKPPPPPLKPPGAAAAAGGEQWTTRDMLIAGGSAVAIIVLLKLLGGGTNGAIA